ncbi:MAG: ECF RNA polymerase sigma-E factor [Syntrophaceae bacterium PtaU1.Bin231]|nr:MAG: ECF RNA polymerase sigma-E factor [Syntrophaceae bacterium PtaU1.Bin231]
MLGTSKEADRQHRATDEDGELVSACRQGDVNAFGVLVAKYQKRAFNIAYRMIGDYEEASDTVQDAFLSAYRSIKKFRGEAKFSTWLYGICINHAKNRLKQARSRSRHEGPSMDDPVQTDDGLFVPDPAGDDPPPDEQVERRELQAMVQGCINGLEAEYREVLILRDIQGFSYEEISVILNIPDGTVKSRLFRARDTLKNSLKAVIGDL